MRPVFMIFATALIATPALAQQGTVHDPYRRPSVAETRRDDSFAQQQQEMDRLRAGTRERVDLDRLTREPKPHVPTWERDLRERRH